jgi:acetolactate synthase-1/2/3 large subunit
VIVADSIAQFLHEKGVDHAFGIIGAGNVALFDAIARLGKTQIVCCHHEQAAAMAATFYGRTRNTVGVCIVTTGAGSSNAITGALAAHMDSAPLLIISGNEPSKYLNTVDMRIVGVQGFYTAHAIRSFVKLARQWHGTRTLPYAYATAIADRPGPVWVDIPRDEFNANV